jgi:peptide/nickel transport system substrate-binding protein
VDEVTLSPEQWMNGTSGKAFDEKNGWLRKVKTPSLAYNYIGFNLKNPVFADAATRVALSHLVDRKRVVDELYYGLARPVTGPFFPDSPATDPTIPVRDFSVEKARKLLAEAGWKDTDGDGILDRNGIPLKFTLIYPNANQIYPRLLPIVRQDMAKAGVKMELLSLEWSVCIQRLEKKQFEACAMGWQGGITPDPFQLWHSSMADVESSSNFIGFSNPAADQLIEEIRLTFDPEKRTELYHKFHRLIYEEAPYIFLVSPYSLSAVSSRYRNLKIFSLGYPTRILWTPRAEQLAVPGL